MGHPVGVAGEARVGGQLRHAEAAAERRELAVVADGDHQRLVLGPEHLVRRNGRVPVAQDARHPVGQGVPGGLVDQARQQGGEQIDLDALPLAGRVPVPQRGQHTDRRVQPGEHVHQRHSGLHRLPGRRPGDAHQSAHGLDQQVVPGQRGPRPGAEAGDRAVDDPGVPGPHVLVAEPVLPQRPRPEVLEQHIGAARQFTGATPVVRVAQIERDGALVAVDGEEVGGLAVRVRRTPGAGVVAALRVLDLDDVRAQVGQEHGGVRRGQHAPEVGDEDAAQRQRDGSGHDVLLSEPRRCTVVVRDENSRAARPCSPGPYALRRPHALVSRVRRPTEADIVRAAGPRAHWTRWRPGGGPDTPIRPWRGAPSGARFRAPRAPEVSGRVSPKRQSAKAPKRQSATSPGRRVAGSSGNEGARTEGAKASRRQGERRRRTTLPAGTGVPSPDRWKPIMRA